MDAGLLLVRVVFGLVMAAHGAQKVFGWFGGNGFSATGVDINTFPPERAAAELREALAK